MSSFTQDWEAVRANAETQFAPVQLPEKATPPGWLERALAWLSDFLSPVGKAIGLSWPVTRWILLGLAIAVLLFVLWKLVGPMLLQARQSSEDAEEEAWSPQQNQAQALLQDADALAAEGQYEAAIHLLLQRSVDDISRFRPDVIEPSSTAREIATLPILSDKARTAFRVIASRVERSLFALHDLSAEDWTLAREAYADFALSSRAQSA
ncbi:hypothetical protein [Altericroceibacterium endophyticum]|uniref:DUF4129 domain-containing protein n=1 Tax=Altericroceibacterium endophyticum TaxID=1808508 RepID=A0A6I4T412_9SPHN|nr:hypothetical protein [Altericroceibacterium endophyticum]MXO65059.1 hypothetical protein [Altericroceibacterium endophyticum]